MRDDTPIALVTGGNRGIGLEVCRQLAQRGHRVVLGSRDLAKGTAAARFLGSEGLSVQSLALDVANGSSIDGVQRWLAAEYGRLDVLVNNAAILYDTWQHAVDADLGVVHEAVETNTFGPWRMTQALLPLLRRSRQARIVNVSSEAGSLAGMQGGTPACSLSKAALNALTRMLGAELRGAGILVNAVCPGWVATHGRVGRPTGSGGRRRCCMGGHTPR